MRNSYRVPSKVDRGYLQYRQAASAFMRWQLRRGLLNPPDAPTPGSPWWRAMNEAGVHSTSHGCELVSAHNMSVVSA
ncbi:hypothetical protein [uncultured Mycobacterium sp.]|uniref:hypothetical protein n=1 Tax=uncultured Mycobacterium sp. TaxID=171292 RepID=UPI0035CC51B5